MFKITIDPDQPFKDKKNTKLKNGKEAFIRKIGPNEYPTIWLIFEKGKYQYILSMNRPTIFGEDALIKIADSIN